MGRQRDSEQHEQEERDQDARNADLADLLAHVVAQRRSLDRDRLKRGLSHETLRLARAQPREAPARAVSPAIARPNS